MLKTCDTPEGSKKIDLLRIRGSALRLSSVDEDPWSYSRQFDDRKSRPIEDDRGTAPIVGLEAGGKEMSEFNLDCDSAATASGDRASERSKVTNQPPPHRQLPVEGGNQRTAAAIPVSSFRL